LNASGLLWSDTALVCFFLYVFGGWAFTLAGWAACLFIGFGQRRWRSAGGCALLGLLPTAYLIALLILAASFTEPEYSDLAFLSLLGGMGLATFACPVVAGVLAWRGRSRPRP